MASAAAVGNENISVVGIGDLKISTDPGHTIITYALGSCLGVAVYDSTAQVGGLLHVMLPLSTIDPEKARQKPFMYVDTGLPRLFLECYKLGAQKGRMVVKVAGGATLQGNVENQFQIGKRNLVILRKMLWKNGVLIQSEDVGGSIARTMSLDLADGSVMIRSSGKQWEL